MKPLHIVLSVLLVVVVAAVVYMAQYQSIGMVRMTGAGPVPVIMNPEERTLRTYQVDPRYRDEVNGTLNHLLTLHELGSVEVLPNGMLAVMAPNRQHQQIEALIEEVNQSQPAPAPAIHLEYWVVEGTPGGSDASDFVIDELRPVLDQLQQTHGPMGFNILESATINSQAGNMSILEGTKLAIHQRASTDGSILNAFVRLRYREDNAQSQSLSMDLNFTARPGEFMVLGKNTLKEKTYFYIVRWPGLIPKLDIGGNNSPRQDVVDQDVAD